MVATKHAVPVASSPGSPNLFNVAREEGEPGIQVRKVT